jgi:hypothetical protein
MSTMVKLCKTHLAIMLCGGFLKCGYPQIIHFTRIFHLQTIHFGIPAFLGTPHIMAAKSTISEPGKPQHPVVVNDAPAESLSHTVDLTKLWRSKATCGWLDGFQGWFMDNLEFHERFQLFQLTVVTNYHRHLSVLLWALPKTLFPTDWFVLVPGLEKSVIQTNNSYM